LLIAKRKARNLPQEELARRLRMIARIESGKRRIDVVEFLALAEAIEFDPTNILCQIQAVIAKATRVVVLVGGGRTSLYFVQKRLVSSRKFKLTKLLD
jgi:transcriptional regulator with XRE-family HTH domain